MKKSLLLSAIAGMLAPAHVAATRYMRNSGLMPSITADDFTRNRVTNPLQSEIVRNTLYDSLLYPTAGATQFNFFATPAGQGVTSAQGATAGATKTYADTNMDLAGQLPNGKTFLAESIELLFLPGSVSTANTYTPAALATFAAANAALPTSINDVNTIYQSGWLEFNILGKNYLREATLLKFPPKAVLQLDAALATTSATAGLVVNSLAKAVGRPYYLDPQVTLQPAVNFEVLIKFPGVVATGSGFNGRMMVTLDGAFLRASQ